MPDRLGSSCPEVANQIRGLSPFPGAFFEVDLGHGLERIKVLRATPRVGAGVPGTILDAELSVACGSGAVSLLQLQRAGKGALKTEDFLRGTRLPSGLRLAPA